MAGPWRPGSKPVSAEELPAVLANHRVVVVHFWAPWNGVDRQFDPKFTPLRQELEQQIEFRSINVDDTELATFIRDCEVFNVPAFGLFVRRQRVGTIVGARDPEELRSELRAIVERSQQAY